MNSILAPWHPIARLVLAATMAAMTLVAMRDHLLIALPMMLGVPFVILGILMSSSTGSRRRWAGPAMWFGIVVIVGVIASFWWILPASYDATTATSMVP